MATDTDTLERRDPWLKFFPVDWQADEALQMCSLAARGLWLELILLMHKAQPYGHLIINGRTPTIDELIRRLRPKSKKEFLDAFAELKANNVCSVTGEGVMFSRRMARRSGRVSASRENGQRGGRPRNPRDNLDGNLEHNLDRNLDANLQPNLEKTPRGERLEARSQRRERPPGGKHPIFVGQRLTVFEWFLEHAERILGSKHFYEFGLDEWFYELDALAVKANLVIPKRDTAAWLEAQLVETARKRGLPIAGRTSVDDADSSPHAWHCGRCGEVHEGTREQANRKQCLRKPA